MKQLKHILAIDDLSAADLTAMLELATRLKQERAALKRSEALPTEKLPLQGRSVAMIFQKPSCRTRISFEAGIYQLGGHMINIQPSEVQMGAREPIRDVARTLSRYVDAVVIRTSDHRELSEFAEYATVPVINGLSDAHHPCQALADMLTLKEKKGELRHQRLCYVGDGNNVCRSLMEISAKLGVQLVVCSPPGYEPADAERFGVELVSDLRNAVAGADAVYTDVWTSMGQEAEREKRLRDFAGMTVTSDVMERARKDAIFMHCLPAHHGEEVAADVFESNASVVFDQAENRLHVQKAMLLHLLRRTA